MEDFYFAYNYNAELNIALRLYRRIDMLFERYNFRDNTWKPAPEQSCIYVGEDAMYDELTIEQVEKLIAKK